MYRNNKIKKIMPYWLSYGSLGVFLMTLGAFSVIFIHSAQTSITSKQTISRLNHSAIRMDTQSSRFILRSGIPALDRTSGEDDPFRLFHFNWSEAYWRLAANIRYATPYEILKTQLPTLTLVNPKIRIPSLLSKQISPSKTEITPIGTTIPATLTKDPLIFIYHTHTTESYIPESGKDHSNPDKGELGDIVKVGAYMKKILEEKYGIRTIHCDQIHDSYPFRESYLRSQITVKEYLKKYPSIQYVFDIHRDATPGIDATCTIHGQKMSTILFVVGTDRMGLAHPHWKENNQLAQKLSQAINRYYPGLNSGIIVSKARYNQHLHHHALLLEFGDQNSTLKEAYLAVNHFTQIFVANLKNPGQDQ